MKYEIYMLSVFLHILAFSIWFGGMIFISLILRPSIMRRQDYPEIIDVLARKFSKITWFFIFPVLFVSGFFNSYFRTGEINPFEWSKYDPGKIALIKLHLFFLIIILSALHDFKFGPKAVELMKSGANPEKFRRLSGIVGRVNFLLGVVMLILGILVVRGC
jgi:putative copper resistance protein D